MKLDAVSLPTKMSCSSCHVIICVVVLFNYINCENILFLYPNASPSHKNPAVPIIAGLANRGHKITVVSSHKTEPHENIQDFHPFKNFDYFSPEVNVLKLRRDGMLGMILMDYGRIFNYCHELYNNEELSGLLRREKFHLVLIDAFANECTLGLIYKLEVPFIYVSSMPIPSHTSPFLGNRLPPSFVPHFLTRYGDKMTFPQRVINMVYSLMGYYGFRRPFGEHEKIYRQYLGNDVPGVDEILANMSLLLSNEHFSFNFPRPNLPDLVDIGAIHCRPGQPLPEDLQTFLDRSPDGVILFSLGSIVRPHEMPDWMRSVFVNVFGRLKQRVLWKWPEEIPNLPSNVKLAPWIPQQDVLAHPNTRLFITHGGLLSTQESIYHGVPMVDIPIFGDQDNNAHRAVEAGIAVTVEILELTEESLEKALTTVLNNSGYTKRVRKLSEYLRDQPQTPKEKAIFWVEYVLRHDGARHIRSAARDLNFFQYYSIDVVLTLVSIIVITILIVVKIVRSVLFTIISVLCQRQHGTKKVQ